MRPPLGRLPESAYRCTHCRRCAQACPIGVDNPLLTREIRKLFSMEMGIAPREIHDKGSLLQLRTMPSGSSKSCNRKGNAAALVLKWRLSSPLPAPIQYLLWRMTLLAQPAQAEGIVPLGQTKARFIAQQIAMVVGGTR